MLLLHSIKPLKNTEPNGASSEWMPDIHFKTRNIELTKETNPHNWHVPKAK